MATKVLRKKEANAAINAYYWKIGQVSISDHINNKVKKIAIKVAEKIMAEYDWEKMILESYELKGEDKIILTMALERRELK